jgi:hypothetical protein
MFLSYFLGFAFLNASSRHLSATNLQVASSVVAPPPEPKIPVQVPVQDVSVLANNKEETTQRQSYIAHNAPTSTIFILNSPAISSFVLVKGWSENSLAVLSNAVDKVIKENPVLSGRATCPKNWCKEPSVAIELSAFLPERGHSFVEAIDGRELPQLADKDSDTAFLLDYVGKFVAPLVGCHDTTLQQIHHKSPLFGVKVVLLPGDYACIYTKMSHCIGDFVTYYQILDQISAYDKGAEAHSINWNNPLQAKHEIVPDDLSKRDVVRLYGLPFLFGIASHLPTMRLRKKEILLLSREKIKRKKEKLKAKGYCEGITSNEIITAALCDANRSTDIFAFTRSMRGVTPGLGLRDGGNLHCEIPFQRCAGRNPLVIKDMIERGKYFEPNEIPVWESLMGRVGRITNCIAPTNKISFGGCKPICFCPAKSFLNLTPLDTAIIFRADKDHYAVMHNFQKMTDSQQLSDILD